MNFDILVGKTLTRVDVSDDTIDFVTDDETYRLFHYQNCCESVYVEDVCGDIADLIGTPILLAEEISNIEEKDKEPPLREDEESYTWTYYKIATIRGHVDIRWYGYSNGYYSESVSFEKV